MRTPLLLDRPLRAALGPPRDRGRILWLAAADARGHLMRAHLMRGLLAREGVRVDVVTTSDEGRAFLAALGTPARVLSREYHVSFDARQNMARRRTEACVARYFARPDGFLRDLATIEAAAREADLVVNDFHPLLLAAPVFARLRVVHVFGENLWRAIERNFEGRLPRGLERLYAAAMRALRARAFAEVEHSLAAPEGGLGARLFRLPPIVPAPRIGRAEVRAALGLAQGERLAAVYLNPHFRDPGLAAALERALAEARFRVHAVGEGYAARPGWLARDARLADAVAAADLFVSTPGMGAVGQACVHGVPLLAIATDQPEQAWNLAALEAARGTHFETVPLEGEPLGPRLGAAIARLAADAPEPRDGAARVAEIHRRWAETFLALLARARAGAIARS